MVGVSTLDTGLLGSLAVPVTIRGVDQIRFSNGTTGARQELPNASGTIALTSNISDSSSALRASINTKLNISDTSAMLNGNYLRLTGGTLTGALSGTSAGFTGGC